MHTTSSQQPIDAPTSAGRGRNPAPHLVSPATPSFFDPGLGGTGGAELPIEAKQFAVGQSKKVRALGGVTSSAMPSWLTDASKSEMAPENIISAVIEKALESADEATILQVYSLLSEMARDPKTSALISARLTRPVVEQFTHHRRHPGS